MAKGSASRPSRDGVMVQGDNKTLILCPFQRCGWGWMAPSRVKAKEAFDEHFNFAHREED